MAADDAMATTRTSSSNHSVTYIDVKIFEEWEAVQMTEMSFARAFGGADGELGHSPVLPSFLIAAVATAPRFR